MEGEFDFPKGQIPYNAREGGVGINMDRCIIISSNNIPYGFSAGSVVTFSRNGPFSTNSANTLEQPGPPVSHITNGSVDGLPRLSKNQ